MRRFAIFALALLLLLRGSPAQSQVRMALSAGINLSTLDFDNPWTWHGGAFGIAFGLPVSERWSLELASNLSGKGYWEKYDECPPGEYGCVVGAGVSLLYLEFMALADRRIDLAGPARLHLRAGHFAGYQGFREYTKAFDHGVAVGSQVEVGPRARGTWGFLAGALYAHGLVNTGPIHDGPAPYQKTRTLTLRIGVSRLIG